MIFILFRLANINLIETSVNSAGEGVIASNGVSPYNFPFFFFFLINLYIVADKDSADINDKKREKKRKKISKVFSNGKAHWSERIYDAECRAKHLRRLRIWTFKLELSRILCYIHSPYIGMISDPAYPIRITTT